jgi:uncharacterized HAD superfamily protein
MGRKTIAIDDVLARSAEGFAAFSNERWGTSMTADDYTEEWTVAWGVSIDEALERSKVLHESGAFGRFANNEAAMTVLEGLRATYDLVVVTSRRIILKSETDTWIEKHFPGIFSGVHYAGIWDETNKDDALIRLKHTKAEICRQIGADYLIDDQLKHCLAAAEAGLAVLLFGDYKWNQHVSLPKNITRTADWGAVQEYFDAQG